MKTLLASAAALAFTLAASSAFAQAGPTTTANANASAEIVRPLAITNQDGLVFGRLAAGAGGTVSILANGTLESSTPNMVIAGSAGNVATFNVTGEGGLSYNADVDDSVTLTSGANSMTAALSGGGVRTLAGTGAGTDSFDVTGVLTVGNGQAPGAYSGSFAVVAQYQ